MFVMSDENINSGAEEDDEIIEENQEEVELEENFVESAPGTNVSQELLRLAPGWENCVHFAMDELQMTWLHLCKVQAHEETHKVGIYD